MGAELRYWDLIQLYSGVQSHNVAPMLDLGWCFDFGIWFVNLCLNQVFVIASWSSIPHAIVEQPRFRRVPVTRSIHLATLLSPQLYVY